jgi:hypothetical protein
MPLTHELRIEPPEEGRKCQISTITEDVRIRREIPLTPDLLQFIKGP